MMRLYVGNLSNLVNSDDLRNLFSPYGTVDYASIKREKNGKSKGFGYVIMSSGGEAAQEALHKQAYRGRTLLVNKTKPR